MKTNGQTWVALLLLTGVAFSLSLVFQNDIAFAGLKDKLKEMKDNAKQKADEAKDKWKESEHPCVDCGKPIHTGTRCALLCRKAGLGGHEKKRRFSPRELGAAGPPLQKLRTDHPCG